MKGRGNKVHLKISIPHTTVATKNLEMVIESIKPGGNKGGAVKISFGELDGYIKGF